MLPLAMRHITLITTGGTIEKTYDEQSGSLENRRSIVGRMLMRLRLEDTKITIIELMSKDSLFMTDDDRASLVASVREASAAKPDGIVVLHGTDTLTQSGERLLKELSPLPLPVVLTGAMRPFENGSGPTHSRTSPNLSSPPASCLRACTASPTGGRSRSRGS